MMPGAIANDHDPQVIADRFLKYSTLGAISAAGVLIITAIGPNGLPARLSAVVAVMGLVNLVMIILLIRSLYVMFRSRNAEEYVRGLWSAGTSASFIAVTFWSLGRSLLTAVAMAVSKSHDVPLLSAIADAPPRIFAVTVIAFFAAVLIQRRRNR